MKDVRNMSIAVNPYFSNGTISFADVIYCTVPLIDFFY